MNGRRMLTQAGGSNLDDGPTVLLGAEDER